MMHFILLLLALMITLSWALHLPGGHMPLQMSARLHAIGYSMLKSSAADHKIIVASCCIQFNALPGLLIGLSFLQMLAIET